jgi:ADP-ribosylglycohydrolase
MYGAIMGDTVGSVYEWHNIKTKDFPLFGSRCHFTDDSVLTVAVADALANEVEAGRFDTNTDEEWREVFGRYLHRYGNVFHGRGYGGGFRRWLHSDDPKPYNSCGNGSAMRVSAVAYFARSLEECERLARLTADVSHDHPDGVAGALATAGAVYLALHGGTKEEIKAYVDKYYGEEVKRYTQENGLSAFTLDEIRPLYSFDHYAGLCKGTVPFALEAFLESRDFEDCIRNTVSIGGDTDTLGAISGAIAEAYYGTPYAFIPAALEKLPPDLRAILDRLDDLDWPLNAKDK